MGWMAPSFGRITKNGSGGKPYVVSAVQSMVAA
jgi:hypothetical protein